MATKVAVVTGGNKGIGLAIVEKLARQLSSGWDVYLTARNESLGKESVQTLEKKKLKVHFHQLDITCTESITRLAAYLKDKYGGLDILVNNAGIAYKQASTAPVSEQAEVTMKTNFYATLNVCDQLFPLLRPQARVVNVSSMSAFFALRDMSDEKRKRFVSFETMDELHEAIHQFLSDCKAGDPRKNGWANSCYGTSKAGVTAMTILQQRVFDRDARKDLVVNACCPGYVNTDMTSHKGHLQPEEGADTPVYLALLPPGIEAPKGKHVSKRVVQEWK